MMDLGGVTDTPLNSQGSIMGINAKKSDKSCRNLYQVYVENVTKNSDKSRRNLYQIYVENVTKY